jgi:hypothetical protein
MEVTNLKKKKKSRGLREEPDMESRESSSSLEVKDLNQPNLSMNEILEAMNKIHEKSVKPLDKLVGN